MFKFTINIGNKIKLSFIHAKNKVKEKLANRIVRYIGLIGSLVTIFMFIYEFWG